MQIIDRDIEELINAGCLDCTQAFDALDAIEAYNTEKVLLAFQKWRVSARHFAPTTGYGYDDIGRDTLSAIMADLMGSDAALVRPQIASGTHALALCLFGLLRPGETLLAGSGHPYDTLEEVIGLTGQEGQGSLRDFGVNYREIDINSDGKIDLSGIRDALIDDPTVKVVEIQRSRGYAWRPSLSVQEIGEAAQFIHSIRDDVIVMVDNCYGEFTEKEEPSAVGADIVAGSMIKNPGGGIAPTGGYIAGRKDLVERIAYRLTSPGIGAEVGSYAASYRPFFQGLFMAPHVVMQALRTAILTASVFEKLGFPVSPAHSEARTDIIQAVQFPSADQLISFIQGIQLNSPIDSDAMPEPWSMPGYVDQVIMAAGTFVAGASIELSADAPIRPPYTAYLQGSLYFQQGKRTLAGALQYMKEKGSLVIS